MSKALSKTPFENSYAKGLGVLKKSHRNLIASITHPRGLESLNLDGCIRDLPNLTPQQRGNAANWDYVVSVGATMRSIERYDALEPHPGGIGEVSKIQNKKTKTTQYLAAMKLHDPDRWVWIQTKNAIPQNDPEIFKLALHGITLCGKNYSL